MKRVFKYSCLPLLAILLSHSSLQAQSVNSLYFIENSPLRHHINPAIEPTVGLYISLPAVGFTNLVVENNALALRDVVYNNQRGQAITFMHPDGSKENFMLALNRNTAVNVDVTMNLAGVGWRRNSGYWHVNINERIDGIVSVPSDLFRLALYGMENLSGGTNRFSLGGLSAEVAAYTEFSLGYSRWLGKQWSVGAKVKVLYGNVHTSLRNSNLYLNASANKWALSGTGALSMAAPLQYTPTDIGDVRNVKASDNWLKWINPKGVGAAFDLGATYKLTEILTLSASITDLGFISWFKGTRYDYKVDGIYDGIGDLQWQNYADQDGNLNTKQLGDTIKAQFEHIYNHLLVPNGTSKGYTKMLSAKINIGGEISFLNNRLGVGVLSRTKIRHKALYQEITTAVAYRPVSWFNMAASYSLFNGFGSSIGAAIGLRGGPLHFTLAADYIPLVYASYHQIALPYKTPGINLAFGLNIMLNPKSTEKAKFR